MDGISGLPLVSFDDQRLNMDIRLTAHHKALRFRRPF